jgi:hypothetical protein
VKDHAIKCRGCHRDIKCATAGVVRPDGTITYQVTMPKSHTTLHTWPAATWFRCSIGVDYIIRVVDGVPRIQAADFSKISLDGKLVFDIHRLHSAGLSVQDIANRLAIDVGPVWKTLGGSAATSGKTPEDQLWDDVRQLWIERRTPQSIAEGLNLDPATVNKWIYTDGAGEYPSTKGVDECCSDCGPDKEGDVESERTLNWWESQYRSKLADLAAGPDRERPMPTPEELLYFEDKIRELGGNPRYAKDLLWLDLQNEIVKEICPELDRPEPAAKPVRARPRLHVFHGTSLTFLGVSMLNYTIGATVSATIWFVAALFLLGAATLATRH